MPIQIDTTNRIDIISAEKINPQVKLYLYYLPVLPLPAPAPENLDLNAMTSLHIRRVLDMCQGRVEGEKGAAGHLNMHPSTLRKRMRKLGIPFGRSASTASS